jgi:hypothetical protein
MDMTGAGGTTVIVAITDTGTQVTMGMCTTGTGTMVITGTNMDTITTKVRLSTVICAFRCKSY